MQTVVGAAIIRDCRVLAARRTTPPEASGRWEFPGGKVEPGESREQAIIREIDEELGVSGSVEGWLDGAVAIGTDRELRVALVRIAGDPRPREHDAVRWLGASELDDVDWLGPDRPFLDELHEILIP